MSVCVHTYKYMYMYVCHSNGICSSVCMHWLQNCIIPGIGESPVSTYYSLVHYHLANPTFMETIKVCAHATLHYYVQCKSCGPILYTCTYIKCISVWVPSSICTHACMYVPYICMCMCMCTYVYVYVYVYVYGWEPGGGSTCM